jgi:hypothetical protein
MSVAVRAKKKSTPRFSGWHQIIAKSLKWPPFRPPARIRQCPPKADIAEIDIAIRRSP